MAADPIIKKPPSDQASERSGRLGRFCTFIIPAVNECEHLEALCEGIREQAGVMACRWEVVFVDDGSSDRTWDVMSALAERDPAHVRAFRFRHHRGKADSLALGYQAARGDIVFTMGAGMRDDPRDLPRFIGKLAEGYDVVSGWGTFAGESWTRGRARAAANAVTSRLVGVSLRDHQCGFRAFRHEVVKALPMYAGMHRMVPALASFDGYRTAEIEVRRQRPRRGSADSGLGGLFSGTVDALTVSFLRRFRDCPMRFAGKLAAVLLALGIASSLGAGVLAVTGIPAGWLAVCGAVAMCTTVIVVLQGLILERQVYRQMSSGERVLPLSEGAGGQGGAVGRRFPESGAAGLDFDAIPDGAHIAPTGKGTPAGLPPRRRGAEPVGVEGEEDV